MITFVYKSTRLSLDIDWYRRSESVRELAEAAKACAKLIDEKFKIEDNGLTLFTTSSWKSKEDYSNYVNSTEMLEWRIARTIYNAENNITFELYSKLED